MNDNLEDTVLDNGVQTDAEVVSADVADDASVDVSTPAVTEKVKKRAGRKVDTIGKTALGAARILYAQNPSLGTAELKTLFFDELNPRFGTTKNVAQTYVSYVRNKGNKKAA